MVDSESESDSDDTSSGSIAVGQAAKRPRRLESTDYESSSGESGTENEGQGASNNNGDWSDSSDGQSEKCPICLLKFKDQEIGSPETCDHTFCVDCIKEWSKNVNTCPVDRQEFNLILVRRELNGRVVRREPVEQKQAEESLVYDTTYCEVCGLSDREDRMLLCDGCDLGFHLDCLDPPLAEVPLEEWFCGECSNTGPIADAVDIYEGEIDRLYEEMEEMGAVLQPRPRRLLPRTRQSERVRTTVETQRREAARNQTARDQPSTSSGFESLQDTQPGTSRRRNVTATTSSTTRKKRKRKTRRRRRTNGAVIEYELDDATNEKFALRRVKKRKRKAKRRKTRRVVTRKTPKGRLATALGIREQKTQKAEKCKTQSGGINHQRHQAGIPTLNIFGQRDQLDYFSDVEDEIGDIHAEFGLLTRARPSTAVSLRVHNRIKAISLPSPRTASTPCDILGSILDSQSKFLSKDTQLSVDEHGTVLVNNSNNNNNSGKIDTNKKSDGLPSENPINVQSPNNERTSQAPMYPGYGGGNGTGNRPSYGGFNNRGGSSGKFHRFV